MTLHRVIEPGLELTPVHPFLAEELYRTIDSSREHLRQWLGWVDSVSSADHTLSFVERSMNEFAEKKSIIWAILIDDIPTGVISFHKIDWSVRRAEIGYWMAAQACGRGVMTRCVLELEHIAFDELDLAKVEIHCASGNQPSRGIPERLNYRQEGILRRAELLTDGSVADHVVYGKLKEEFSG